MARVPLRARTSLNELDPALEEDPMDAGPPPPDFGGGPPMGMGAAPGGMPPMAGAGMGMPPMGGDPTMGGGVGAYPSTNPALVAQLLGPLLAAQQQDEQRLQQEQAQSVIEVLMSMKKSEAMSADAATAPAPVVEAPTDMPPQGGGGY